MRLPLTGRCVIIEFAGPRFYWESRGRRIRDAAILLEIAMSSISGIRPLLCGSGLISVSRIPPSVGKCVNLAFGDSLSFMRNCVNVGFGNPLVPAIDLFSSSWSRSLLLGTG